MQPISEALKRARLELGQGGSSVTHLGDRGTRSGDGTVLPIRENIVYSHTRTVEVKTDALRAKRVVSGYLPGPYVDAYKILCTQVTQRLREKQQQVLAITSPGDHEGKTLTAINLACCLANEIDQTVLLVDADLRQPRMHEYFGIQADTGLTNVLNGDARIQDVLVHPGIGKLVLLPGGRPTSNSSELLGSQRMQTLVRELKARYASRTVIFDLPPVLSAADVLAFAPFVEALLLVVEDGVTDKERLQQTGAMLSGLNVLGTVLNKVRMPEPAEGHRLNVATPVPAPRRRWPWRR